MKSFIVLFAALFGVTAAQFPNGRILEPPVPALCSQRIIHDRTPDGEYQAENCQTPRQGKVA